jgi:heme-degrading monooxygenase HmoA
MVLEHAVLQVRAGQETAFESAFARAKSIIACSPGFQSLTLSRCIEDRGRYLLIVEWGALEDHTEGFRQSARYQEWRALLHHFYDPFPSVDHYDRVDSIP